MSSEVDHPLIYCNGDSYSDENYHASLYNNTYAQVVGRHYNGFVINNAIKGSCNRRIIRTSVYDLIQQREANPHQTIIALISLSFELRGEIWNDDIHSSTERESNFLPHVFADFADWKDKLLKGLPIHDRKYNEFLDKYTQGRAYLYSPYAERINLMCDLIMFQALMKNINIKFLMFQGPLAERLEQEHVLDFFKHRLDPNNFFDFETFGFVNWCSENNFIPLDMHDRPTIAHYGPDAHKAFAERILIPAIEKLRVQDH